MKCDTRHVLNTDGTQVKSSPAFHASHRKRLRYHLDASAAIPLTGAAHASYGVARAFLSSCSVHSNVDFNL